MIQFRKLNKKNIPFLMKTMEENNDSTRNAAKTWYLENIRKGEEWDFIIVLNKKPIGVIGYCKENRRYAITWFHLQKQYQNMGYGSESLKKVEKIISKHAPCEVQVDTGYPRAVRFYKKNGYNIMKTIPNYYPMGGSNIILRKKIKI